MDIYFAFAFILLIESLLFAHTKYFKRIEGILLFIALGYWCVLSAFRDSSVGFDTTEYMKYYRYAQNDLLTMSSKTIIEKGFVFLMRVACRFDASFEVFQLFICAIAVCITLKTTKAYRLRTFLVFLLYTIGAFFNLMNQERSALGAFLCILAIDRLANKEVLQAVIIWIIACTIHFGMIAFSLTFVAYLLRVRINKRNIAMFCAVGMSVFFAVNILISIMLRFFPKYNIYFTDKKSYIKNGNVTFLLFFIAIVFFAIYSKKMATKKDRNVDKIYDVLVWNALSGAMLSLIVLKISMAQRFIIPALFSTPFLIVKALELDKDWVKRLVKGCFIAFFFLAYMYIYLYTSENGMGRDGVVPYVGRFYG